MLDARRALAERQRRNGEVVNKQTIRYLIRIFCDNEHSGNLPYTQGKPVPYESEYLLIPMDRAHGDAGHIAKLRIKPFFKL